MKYILVVLLTFLISLLTATAQPNNRNGEVEYRKGYSHHKGGNSQTNLTEAFHWYLLAAEQGHTKAQVEISRMYTNGLVIQQNLQLGFRWAKRAADNGDAEGMLLLGSLYEHGLGVNVDLNNAAYWIRRSAENDYDLGQANFGRLFEYGIGIPQNYEHAIKWYKLAANKNRRDYGEYGSLFASVPLAKLYETGKGTEQNKTVAYAIYALETYAGNLDAQQKQEALERSMTQEEIKNGRALSSAMNKPRNWLIALDAYLSTVLLKK